MVMQITPKGVLITAKLLCQRGLIRRNVVERVQWFVDSGIGWENPQFRKLWKKIQFAVRASLANGDFDDLYEEAKE